MFSRFSAKPPKAKDRLSDNASQSLSIIESRRVSGGLAKRQKITKACDRCRSHRIKCDKQKPCTNCVGVRTKCIISYETPHSSAANSGTAPQAGPASLTVAGSTPYSARNEDSELRQPSDENSYRDRHPTYPSPYQDRDATSGAKEVDVPSTSTGSFPDNDAHAETYTAREQTPRVAAPPTGSLFPQLPHPAIPSIKAYTLPDELSRSQRSHFFQTFWEVCHPILMIMSEKEFFELSERPPVSISGVYTVEYAMLDAMIALGIQHSYAAGLTGRLSGFQRPPSWNNDWPGFEYFYRSRERMRDSCDDTLDAIRCHTFLALYLIRGNAVRDAYNLLGITIRKAYISRLHRVPPDNLSSGEKTARAQVWWSLSRLDVECALQLDMPAATQRSLVKCPAPTEDALISYVYPQGSQSSESKTCKYAFSVRDLARTLSEITEYVSTADIMEACATGFGDLEQQAAQLLSLSERIESWRRSKDSELHYDPSRGAFDLATIISPIHPLWLQRQIILLEIHYHHACVLIQRPFLNARQANSGDTGINNPRQEFERQSSAVDQHIEGALHHAVGIIDIIFGVCSTSDVLYGWSEVLQPIWNAMLTVMAYVYVNPATSQTKQVFDHLLRAQSVLASFGLTCSTAATANGMVASLIDSLRVLLAHRSQRDDYDDLRGWDFLASSFGEQPVDSVPPGETSLGSGYISSAFSSFAETPFPR